MPKRAVNLDGLLINDIGDKYGIGPEKDLFGLEVELEGRKVTSEDDNLMKFWMLHQDGSLRANKRGSEAIEYVFRKPLTFTDTEKGIRALFDYLTKTPNVEVFDSYRTSIHVHVNCLNETLRTVVNYITLCIIFDELLVSQNGATRIGNNFCLRSRDAEGQVHDLIKSVSEYGSLYNLQPNHRYSATNFSSLLKFGTIEFRSLECTTDYDRLMHWIKTVQALKVAARQYGDPREIIAKFSRKGPLGFMLSTLGDQYLKYINVQGSQEMLRNGMRLAQDFAFCTDWKSATTPDRHRVAKEPPMKVLKPSGHNPFNDVVAPGQVPAVPAWMVQHFQEQVPMHQPLVEPEEDVQINFDDPDNDF